MRRSYHRQKPKEEKNFRANEHIRYAEVDLIDADGQRLGVMPTAKALALAQEAGLDLVEVNPKATPPIAKIIDYGQFKYERDKKTQKQKAKNKKTDTKTIRLSVRIGAHDFNVRLIQAKNFLKRGHKLLLELRLKGREKQHPETAREVMLKFYNQLKTDAEFDLALEQDLTKQGGQFNMIIVNKKS
jgi:translation initiation factor IF-3